MYAEVCYVDTLPSVTIQREAIPVEEFDFFGPFQARPIDRLTKPHLLRYPGGVVGSHFSAGECSRIGQFLRSGEPGECVVVAGKFGRYRVEMFEVGDGVDLNWKSV
jgi:hypothetical protein